MEQLFTITHLDKSSLDALSVGLKERAHAFVRNLQWLPYMSATISYDATMDKFSLHEVTYPMILTQFDRNIIRYYTLRDQLIADEHTGNFALVNSDGSVSIFERPSSALASKTDKDACVIHIGYEGESVLTIIDKY